MSIPQLINSIRASLESLDSNGMKKHEAVLIAEANKALEKGGIIGAVFGYMATLMTLGLYVSGALPHLILPVVFAFVASTYCLLVYKLAKKKKMRGRTAYAVFLPFLLSPLLFFIAAELMYPAGAATFINGPIGLMPFILIAITGFLFNYRLSVIAGLVSAVEYLVIFALAKDGLELIQVPFVEFKIELASIPIRVITAFMIVFSGFLVAGMTIVARRLLNKVIHKEQENFRINKLFGQYVSDEVREKIISEKAGIKGTQKHMVVLFSDIRGFTTFSEQQTCESIVDHLNEYFDEMAQAIGAQKGTIDKFIGDAIMALFGGVIELPNPCNAAFLAAREMRTRLYALNKKRLTMSRAQFQNGIGMHYGDVLLGNIGSSQRKDFTVIGDAVNTAARIEGLTKEYPDYPILVTQSFYDQLSPEFKMQCTRLDDVSVKGKKEKIRIYGIAD